MKSRLPIALLLFIIPALTLAQSKFEKGYFIDSKGLKTSCLIKNEDWKYNPHEFEYKLKETSGIQKMKIDDVTSFGIDSISLYEKHIVVIDKYNDKSASKVSMVEYDFQTDTIFLKVVVKGNANLYEYSDPGFKRYFFNKGESKVTQLDDKIFKKTTYSGTKLEYNKQFRIQLYEALQCETLGIDNFTSLKLKKNTLKKIFDQYNRCSGKESIKLFASKKKASLQIRARIGAGLMDFNSKNPAFRYEFENKIVFRIGVELEYILPFQNGRWSIIFEPSTVHFKEKYEIGTSSTKFQYNAIQTAIGLRYNYSLSTHKRLFASLVHVPEFVFSSGIYDSNGVNTLPSQSFINFLVKDYAVGAGMVYDKWNIELRHHFGKSIDLQKSYQVTQLILGYRFY